MKTDIENDARRYILINLPEWVIKETEEKADELGLTRTAFIRLSLIQHLKRGG